MAKAEGLKETRVMNILEEFKEKALVLEVEEGFIITEEGKEKAWQIAIEDLP